LLKFGHAAYLNDWLRVGNKNKSLTYQELIPPRENLMCCEPLTVDPYPHPFLALFGRLLSSPGVVITFQNGSVYPEKGIIQTKEGYIIIDLIDELVTSESIPDWRPKISQDKTKKNLKLKTIAIALNSSRNYYTWMGEVLSKFYLLMKSGHWKKIDHFLVADIAYNYQREVFKAFGILNKVLTIKMLKDIKTINAREIMVVPTNKILPKWGCDALQKCFSLFKLSDAIQRDWQDYKRIYVSREDARFRKVINEDEVVSFLNKYGFKKVVLSTLDVATQVYLFRNAEVVAGPHGSAFTNIASCRKGAKIVEFFSTEYAHSTYWEMSNYLGLIYGYISEDGGVSIAGQNEKCDEKYMVINVNQLEKLFQRMQIKKK